MTASTGNDLPEPAAAAADGEVLDEAAGTTAADSDARDTGGAGTAPAVATGRRLLTGRRVGRRGARSASARRRRRSSTLVLSLALMATGVLWTVLAPSGSATDAASDNEAVRQGRALYLQGCSSCHGVDAAGTVTAPSLIGVGAAAVDFQMSTGRMPLAAPAAQADRKEPLYNQTEIDQIAAYIQSLGGGLEKPEVTEEELSNADLTHGGELYRSNCAQCHQAAGQGAPLTYGKYAPALTEATPTQIIEAMRTGPESMPVFGEGQISDEEATAVAAYILEMRDEPSLGGNKVGGYGPVPEGLVAWLIGIGGLLGVCLWIGARQKV
ncbi:MAG: c-type cytochrome [Frankia sp.]|nr:c-type cytochrome [Frankia sp.]